MIYNGFDTLRSIRPELERQLKQRPEGVSFSLVPHISGTLSLILTDEDDHRLIVRDNLKLSPLQVREVTEKRPRRGRRGGSSRRDPGPPRSDTPDDVWRDLVRGLSRL